MKKGSLLILCFVLCACLHAQTTTSDETRNVPVKELFTSIFIKGTGDVTFTQANTTSVRLVGPKVYLDALKVTVTDGCLTIDVDDKYTKMRGIDVYVSAPKLEEVCVQGVGNFTADTLKMDNLEATVKGVGNIKLGNIKCQNLKLSVQGTGNINANVNCSSRLFVSLEGVGGINLSGYAKRASFSRRGIGLLKKKMLKVDKEI